MSTSSTPHALLRERETFKEGKNKVGCSYISWVTTNSSPYSYLPCYSLLFLCIKRIFLLLIRSDSLLKQESEVIMADVSQFDYGEDLWEEEPPQEEDDDDFNVDVGDTEEEEEEEKEEKEEEEEEEQACNVPEATINTVLNYRRFFSKDEKLKTFNDCYDKKDEFIPLVCRGDNDRKQKLEELFGYRLVKDNRVRLIAQKLTLLLRYVLDAGELDITLKCYTQLMAMYERTLQVVQEQNDAAQAARDNYQRKLIEPSRQNYKEIREFDDNIIPPGEMNRCVKCNHVYCQFEVSDEVYQKSCEDKKHKEQQKNQKKQTRNRAVQRLLQCSCWMQTSNAGNCLNCNFLQSTMTEYNPLECEICNCTCDLKYTVNQYLPLRNQKDQADFVSSGATNVDINAQIFMQFANQFSQNCENVNNDAIALQAAQSCFQAGPMDPIVQERFRKHIQPTSTMTKGPHEGQHIGNAP